MKISRKFVLILTGIILLCFLLMLQMPRHFNWNATFNINSSEPFGTKLFDSLMSASLPNGYELTTDDLDDYLRARLNEEGEVSENLLIIDEQVRISQVTDSLLYTFAKRGGKAIIACSKIYADRYTNTIKQEQGSENEEIVPEDTDEVVDYPIFEDEEEYLHFYFANVADSLQDTRSGFFNIGIARVNTNFEVLKGLVPVTLLPREPHTYQIQVRLLQSFIPAVYPFTQNDSITCSDSFLEGDYTLQSALGPDDLYFMHDRFESSYNKKLSTTMTFHFGEGSICVSLAGLYFSNYGAVDKAGRTYLMRLLTSVGDRRIVRVLSPRQYTAYIDEENELSLFSFFLERPPLAMALRLTIIAALLALFVNARRRQRAIPLSTLQPNITLHFLRQVSVLYRPADDYSNLLDKRFKVFADRVRRRTGADISDIDEAKRREAAHIVAVHTGENFDEVHTAIREIQFYLAHEEGIRYKTFRNLVDRMNRIQQKL